MALAYRRYRCNTTHFDGTTLFRAGIIYFYPVDPGAYFDQTDDDPLEFNTVHPHLDTDGTLYFAGNVSNYDDWRFPLAQSKQGSNLKPDFDQTNNGYLFPQNDTAEVLYMTDVSSHKMQVKAGMTWFPHIHYIQDEAEIPVYEYRIKLTAAGAAVPAWSSWIATTGEIVFPYSSGSIHQIVLFPEFDAYALGATSFASLIDLQLRRNDNVVSGDVLTKQFDIHVLFDSPLGSGQEFVK